VCCGTLHAPAIKVATGAAHAIKWQLQHRYMQVEGMAGLVPPTIDGEATSLPSAQITPKAAWSVATSIFTEITPA